MRYAIEVRTEMSAADIEAVWRLLRTVADADGHPPIGEHRWLDLVQGGRETRAGLLARTSGHDGALVGYAQLSRGSQDWSVDLVVHPHHRMEGDPLGEELLRGALDEVAHRGGGHVHLWVPKPTAESDRIAAANSLRRGRDLLQLRRPLPLEADLEGEGAGLTVRPFVPGEDDDAWLDVNNRAFAWHPEQGGWSREVLTSRQTEGWFDPAGFLVHEEGGAMAGFCWTKVHDDHDPPLGEIYVIAVDPSFQGRGLGRQLTLAGLSWLSGKGLRTGMLYVDASNTRAVSLYEDIGFQLDHIDRAYVADIAPS